METIKAGCYLLNKENKTVALVYRESHNDYSFPKGHLDAAETIKECAIRETEEETKRTPIILNQYEPIVERYATPKGEHCVCYMFFALDGGKSDNDHWDTHPTHQIPFEKVEETLSYESLRKTWRQAKAIAQKIMFEN